MIYLNIALRAISKLAAIGSGALLSTFPINEEYAGLTSMKSILFKVKNNKKVYIVRGLRRKDYLDWVRAPSKGKYFRVIQKKYDHSWFYYAPEFTIIKFSKVEPTGR